MTTETHTSLHAAFKATRRNMEKRKRETIARLDATLRAVEEDVREATHVHPGAEAGILKASVRGSSNYDSLRDRWEGRIEVGGEGRVGEALFYEQRRAEKDPSHDPMHRRVAYDQWLKETFDQGMTE
jgi:hypothetical protein